MAISFVGSKTYSAAGANSGTFSVSLTDLKDTAGNNAALAQGDLLIITNVVGGTTDKGSANLLASGWTGVAPSDGTGQYANGSSNDTNLQAQYKVMGATPDTTVSIPNSGSTADAVAGTVLAIRGSASGPSSSSAITGTGTGRPDAPSVTPTVAGSWIVVCGGAAAAAGSAFTNPGDLSSTTNHFRSISSPDTIDAMAGCGIKTDWTSGAFNPSQWTGGTTGAGDSWAAVTMVVESVAIATGTLAKTEAGDTVSSAGTVRIVGTVSKAEAGDTTSSAGKVLVRCALAKTEAGDSRSLAGTVLVRGAATRTEASDSIAATGTVSDPPIVGTLNKTEAGDSVSAAGTVRVVGTLARNEAADALSAFATVSEARIASLIATEADDDLSSAALCRLLARIKEKRSRGRTVAPSRRV